MPVLLLLLVAIEVLTLVVIKQHYYNVSRARYYLALLAHVIASIWLWMLVVGLAGYSSFFDNPVNVWMVMSMVGMFIAVIMPRMILIVFHFAGKLARLRSGGHIRWLTGIALYIAFAFLAVTGYGTFIGKFRFSYETVTISIPGLHKDLEGLKIAHISDLHLSGFYHHPHKLEQAVRSINEMKPDLIMNTGDFVSFGWREFGRFDTILSQARSRYGNFAIRGNHDAGTYHPDYTEADIANNIRNLNRLITASGYTVLNDESSNLRIGDARLAIIGLMTGGRHPEIIHGDLHRAMEGTDSADLRILLSHNPNQWEKEVAGIIPGIQVTLSGHTHGMQMGIMTKKFRWSPSKYFYPHWNGLYSKDDQFHYVNRGLGVIALPARIWMPPEITIIELRSK